MNKLLITLALVATAFSIPDPIITESQTVDGDSSDFSCKLAMQFDNTGSWTAATHPYTTISWSETVGLWEDGTDLNACYIKTSYDASNDIEFGTGAIDTNCFLYKYDGETWEVEALDASDYQVKCVNPTTKGTDLDGYTCTLYFDKSSDLGIDADSEYFYFAFSRSTTNTADLTATNAVAKKDRFFSTGDLEAINFGDSKCNLSSIYSMVSGVFALAALAFF